MRECIHPKQDTAFVGQIEQAMEFDRRPYDAKRPVVCMDEQSKQLIAETRRPLAVTPGNLLS